MQRCCYKLVLFTAKGKNVVVYLKTDFQCHLMIFGG
jgi:hypothetical protein